MRSNIKGEGARRHPVVIFGGFGMKRAHCTRLARLYRRLGAGDILVLDHPLHKMIVPAFGDRQARKLAAFFASAGYEDDVTVHVFSGSVFLAGRILRYLPEQTKNAIKSVVLNVHRWIAGRKISAALLPGGLIERTNPIFRRPSFYCARWLESPGVLRRKFGKGVF